VVKVYHLADTEHPAKQCARKRELRCVAVSHRLMIDCADASNQQFQGPKVFSADTDQACAIVTISGLTNSEIEDAALGFIQFWVKEKLSVETWGKAEVQDSSGIARGRAVDRSRFTSIHGQSQ
jgi:hypothetical protein